MPISLLLSLNYCSKLHCLLPLGVIKGEELVGDEYCKKDQLASIFAIAKRHGEIVASWKIEKQLISIVRTKESL